MGSEEQPFEGEIVEHVLAETQPAPLPPEIVRKRGFQRLERITVEQIEGFLRTLEQTGTLCKSAEIHGLPYQSLRRLKQEDELFRELVDEALQVYRESLEAECHRRAIDGWDEPVFSQKTGEKMGVVRKYDSRLLELMLKRHIPEYREKFEGNIKISGGVLIAPIAPISPEAWAEKHEKTELNLLAGPEPSTTGGSTEGIETE